jgi:uncharacterized membrane protein YfcA
MTFPVSGVEAEVWVPPLVAFAVSFFTSMAGISGAVLLLPFQMSVLGFTSPAVSPTNLVYNVVAIPSGALRYLRERRMVWPLAWIVVAGTLPGVFVGGFIRLRYLPDPGLFKAFAGCVLLYIAVRLAREVLAGRGNAARERAPSTVRLRTSERSPAVNVIEFTRRRLTLEFRNQKYSCGPVGISLLSLAVGLVGGVYGIGGGAIIAPYLVAIYGLPVYVVAGAALLGTFVTSVAGVAFYQVVGPLLVPSSVVAAPDWALGALFGVGGMAGMYLGARTQRFVPSRWIKVLLCLVLVAVAVRYLFDFLF